MRTGIIGNSHLLAVKLALTNRFGERFGAECFCGFHEWRIEGASREQGRNGILQGNIVGRRAVLDLDKFDQFVICGLGWWEPRNDHLAGMRPPSHPYAHIVPPSHPLAHVSIARWGRGTECQPAAIRVASGALFDAVVEARVRDTNVARLVQYLATNTSCRLILQPSPAPSRALKYDREWLLNSWYGENGPLAWFDYFRAQRLALTRLAEEYGNRAVLLDYPLDSIEKDGFMDASLCDRDPFHGNMEYGNLIVDQLGKFV